MYGFASTYACFKCLKPKISIIWLKILNACDNMTSAQSVRSGSVPAKARKQIWFQQLMTWCTERSNHTGVIVRFWDQSRLITPRQRVKWPKPYSENCIGSVIYFLFWLQSHSFTWRGQGLWPVLQQPDTRGQSKSPQLQFAWHVRHTRSRHIYGCNNEHDVYVVVKDTQC